MIAPLTADPVSAATPFPYPGINIFVPSGIMFGSTATIPRRVCMPIAVNPRKAYAVATTVIVLSGLWRVTGFCGGDGENKEDFCFVIRGFLSFVSV